MTSAKARLALSSNCSCLHDTLDQTSRDHSIYRLGDVELAHCQHSRYLADRSLSVNKCEQLPFVRTNIDRRFGAVTKWRDCRHRVRIRHLVCDARPFVDAPRALHQLIFVPNVIPDARGPSSSFSSMKEKPPSRQEKSSNT